MEVLCPNGKVQAFCKRRQRKVLSFCVSGIYFSICVFLLEKVGYGLMVNLDSPLPTTLLPPSNLKTAKEANDPLHTS